MAASVQCATSDWNVTCADKGPRGLVSVTVTSTATSAVPEATLSFDASLVRGTYFSPWLGADRWEEVAAAVKLRGSDVVVATFPKSGTTLAEQAVLLFQSGALDPGVLAMARDKNALGRRPARETAGAKVWPEACLLVPKGDPGEAARGAEFAPLAVEDFDAMPAPRLVKTHAPSHLVVGEVGGSLGGGKSAAPKFVVVVRSPKDVVVSSYYHAWNPAKSGWPFSAWVAAWLSGTTPSGSWTAW